MHKLFFILSGLSLLTACIAEPDYPDAPTISFEEIRVTPGGIDNLDSVTVVINFQDGNGDLGLSPSNPEDTLPPYQSLNPDGTLNKFRNNIFVTIELTENGTFEPIELPDGQGFDGRFPLLNTLDRPTTLEGTISYTIGVFYGIFGSPLDAGDEIRMRVQIADRALNESNIIETPTVILGQPE